MKEEIYEGKAKNYTSNIFRRNLCFSLLWELLLLLLHSIKYRGVKIVELSDDSLMIIGVFMRAMTLEAAISAHQ